MIHDGWRSSGGLRKAVFLLAIIGLAYLIFQTQPGPARLSAWTGGRLGAASGGIVANAAPLTGRGNLDPDVPAINPLGQPNTVMTQGYGVGSHAPANIWGAVDLAIDGDGDGDADPEGSWGAPVYATHDGVAHLARDTWPAGNHIWLTGQQFKTGYAHLQGFAVEEGQAVRRGEVIGYVGSTGQSSGPHLDYQVWKDGVNVNPLDYGALAGTH